jgi:hypothetical protein
MTRSEGNTMDAETQITGAVAMSPSHDGQRLHPRYNGTVTLERTQALRAKLIAATVQVVAEAGGNDASNPRLVETRHTHTAP